MTVRLHHTQVKQAAKLGVTLTKGDMDVTASRDGQSASAPSAGLAIAALLRKLGVSTADVMKAIKPAKKVAKIKKVSKAKGKLKFRCEAEDCKSTKRESDGDGGFICSECGEDASMDGDDEGKSVVKRKYKTAYKPNKNTCGDAVTKQVRTEFMTKKDPDTKKLLLDWSKFVRFAKNNDCWTDTYGQLNHGLARMSVVNRLRARINKKLEIKWAV